MDIYIQIKNEIFGVVNKHILNLRNKKVLYSTDVCNFINEA